MIFCQTVPKFVDTVVQFPLLTALRPPSFRLALRAHLLLRPSSRSPCGASTSIEIGAGLASPLNSLWHDEIPLID
jgi:hypothetical protein